MKRNTPTQRAEKWVLENFPSLTRRQAQQSLSEGFVLDPEGKPLKKGDSIHQTPDASKLVELLAKIQAGNPFLELAIVAEEADYWVVDKPAGMPSHPVQLTDFETITHWALARDPQLLKEFPDAQPTLCPHRLDTGTSGLLIVARTRQAYERWRLRFHNKEISKTYLAWCWGEAKEKSFELTEPIGHHRSEYGTMVSESSPFVKEPIMKACSQVNILQTKNEMTLAEVFCSTGVTHQVRVHLASAELPLVGDSRYDPLYPQRKIKPPFHALRATQLSCGKTTYRVDEKFFRDLEFLS